MNTTTTWRKSSRSNDTGTCVELNNTLTHVRDSKNPSGPTIRVPKGFVSWVKKQG